MALNARLHSILLFYFKCLLNMWWKLLMFFKRFEQLWQYNILFFCFRMEAEILEATTQELMMHDYPSDCCPEGCYLRFPCLAGDPDSPFWQGWGNLRIKTFRLIENKYFEMAVITMILISSLALVSMYLYLWCT